MTVKENFKEELNKVLLNGTTIEGIPLNSDLSLKIIEEVVKKQLYD